MWQRRRSPRSARRRFRPSRWGGTRWRHCWDCWPTRRHRSRTSCLRRRSWTAAARHPPGAGTRRGGELAVALRRGYGMVHCWLVPPVQVYRSSWGPLAVDWALSSTHLAVFRPDVIGPVGPPPPPPAEVTDRLSNWSVWEPLVPKPPLPVE